jgi:ABC-2 type transport system permease protein
VLLVLAGVAGVVQGIAADEGREDVAGWAGLISPFSLVDGVQVWVLGADSSTVIGPQGDTAGLVFVLVTAAVIGACYLLLLRRYRKVSVA